MLPSVQCHALLATGRPAHPGTMAWGFMVDKGALTQVAQQGQLPRGGDLVTRS